MSKKKKQAVKKPPLSKRDKWIYNLVIVIGFVLILLLWLLFWIRIPRAIGFSKQGVIACGDQSGVLTSLPFALRFCGLVFIRVRCCMRICIWNATILPIR